MIVSDGEFDGHITLFRINAVRKPLYVPNCGQMICIADSGYSWLHHIPRNGRHVITAMFDAAGDVVQWYIDICSGTGVSDDLVPWFDDLYLDLIVQTSGEFELLDADELQEALDTGVIDQALFDLAWEEANRLQELLERNHFGQLTLASNYRKQLLKRI